MQLPCVIMQDNMFFCRDFYFYLLGLNLNLTQTKKVKITTKNILSQMITQGGSIYKFIQFNLIEKCANLFHENPRKMKGTRYKMLLICLGSNKKLFIPEIMKLRVKMRDKNSPKIE